MHGPVYVGSAQWVAASPGSRTVGVFRKTDPRGDWEPLSRGLPEHVEIRAIAVHPEDGGTSWQSYVLPQGVEGVYAIACP